MVAESLGQLTLMPQDQLNPGHHLGHHLSLESMTMVSQESVVLLHEVQDTELVECQDTALSIFS